jgi:hypothetical protein
MVEDLQEFRVRSINCNQTGPICTQESAMPAGRFPKKPKAQIDPKFLTAARVLRDRWLQGVNREAGMLQPVGRYEVCREIAGASRHPTQTPRLEAA